MERFYDNIIVPIDFGERTDLMVRQAYAIARLMNTDIALVHVSNKQRQLSYDQDSGRQVVYADTENDTISKLKRLAAIFESKFDIGFNYQVLEGEVTGELVTFAEKIGARMLVMGNSGRTHSRTSGIGTNTAQVIRRAKCPVLTVNSEIRESFERILLPLDLSKQINQKIQVATQFGRYYDAMFRVVTVINQDNFSKEQEYSSKLEQVREFLVEHNLNCSTELMFNFDRTQRTGSMLLNYSKNIQADLIMIMTQQEKDWKHMFLGSTAAAIIKESEVPVLSVTPYQFSQTAF